MAKRIAKKIREEAAVLCSIAACTPWEAMAVSDDVPADENEWQEGDWFQSGAPDESTEAGRLAVAASQAAPWIGVDERWAEAEAMLRCGWEPSNG